MTFFHSLFQRYIEVRASSITEPIPKNSAAQNMRWGVQSFQNNQEYILHEIVRHSLGGWGAFTPDCYDGSKEPADVAWVSDNTCVLMYCMAGGKKRESKDRKNSNQASRWMKKWKKGKILNGKNYQSNFSISFKESLVVRLISISDNSDCDDLSYVKTMDCDEKILCITQNTFEWLLSRGLNARDISAVFDVISEAGYMDFDTLKFCFEELFRNIFQSGLKSIRSEMPIDVVFESDEVRNVVSRIKAHEESDVSGFDLSYAESCWISGVVAAGKEFVRRAFDVHGALGFAFAGDSIFDSNIFVAVCANPSVANDKLNDWNDYWSKPNVHFFQVFGYYPEYKDVWSYAVSVNGKKVN